MSIEFDCPSCGKHYSVSEGLAGKRAKCRGCQAAMTVPEPAPTPDEGPDFDGLAALEAAAADSGGGGEYDDADYRRPAEPVGVAGTTARATVPPPPPSLPPLPGVSRRASAGGPGGGAGVAVASGFAGSGKLGGSGGGGGGAAAGAVPAWAAPWVALLGRSRGLPWWAWALLLVGGLLLAGFVSDLAAAAAMYGLGGVGLLAVVLALAWGVVVGVAAGSKAIVGALVASPLLTAYYFLKAATRQAAREASPFAGVSTGVLVGGFAFGLGAVAIVAGMLTNPAAFKRPVLLGAGGLLLLVLCYMPTRYRASHADPYAGRPTARGYGPGSGGWTPRPPGPTYAGQPPRAGQPPFGQPPASFAPPPPPDPVRRPVAAARAEPAAGSAVPELAALGSAAGDRVVAEAAAAAADAAASTSARASSPSASPAASPVPAASAAPAPAAATPKRPPAAAPTTPPARAAAPVAPPRPAVAVPPSPVAGPPTNQPIQAKWGGTWYDAKVVRQERGWTQVEYKSDGTREWVEPWRTRPAGSKADDVPPASPNATWNHPDAPAPAGPPGPKPAR